MSRKVTKVIRRVWFDFWCSKTSLYLLLQSA